MRPEPESTPAAPTAPRAPAAPAVAVALTVLAVCSFNLGLAYVLARAVGLPAFELPPVVPWGLLALGLGLGALAVVRWRAFVARARAHRAGAGDAPKAATGARGR